MAERSAKEATERAFAAWLEEYKALGADIGARVDLQHRNVNLLVVLMTAITGYLVNYWKDHGLHHGPAALVHNEVAVFVVVAPLFANVFVWRHLDHDQNIIDKAAYIDTVLRPSVSAAAGAAPVLEWEAFQRARRLKRPWKPGLLVLLGNEYVPMLLFVGVYLAAGWYMRLYVHARAGEARHLFDVLLYLSSALFVGSVYMSVVTALAYGGLGERANPEKTRARGQSRIWTAVERAGDARRSNEQQ